MSKALYVGGTPSSLHLLDEVQSLRRRVAELEAALAEAEQAASHRADADVVDLRAEPIRSKAAAAGA